MADFKDCFKLKPFFRFEHALLIRFCSDSSLNPNTDLQDAAQRAEASAVRREENLRHELAESAERIKDGERRNHELSGAIQGATRPLLRQIENLQMTNSNHR